MVCVCVEVVEEVWDVLMKELEVVKAETGERAAAREEVEVM